MLNFKTVNIFFIVLLVTTIVANFFIDFNHSFIVFLLCTWLVLTMFGSGLIRWGYFLKSHYHNPFIQEPLVSITFDDGPHPIFTPQVLSLLKKFDSKATFFCIGKNIEANPDLLKQISDDGHTVGNHTYNHGKGFGFLSSEKILEELNTTTELISKVLGKNVTMYRPAYGVTNPNIKRALNKTGMVSIGWSKRSLDTMPFSEKYTLKRITHNLKPGDIILLHDTSEKSIAVLEHLLLFLKTQNLKSVTVDKLLNLQPYE